MNIKIETQVIFDAAKAVINEGLELTDLEWIVKQLYDDAHTEGYNEGYDDCKVDRD